MGLGVQKSFPAQIIIMILYQPHKYFSLQKAPLYNPSHLHTVI